MTIPIQTEISQLAQVVMFLICSPEIPTLNLSQHINYPVFLRFISVPPNTYEDITSNYVMTHFLAYYIQLGSTAQFWALAAYMKLSVSHQLLDLGQSAGLVGQVISSSQGQTCPDATLSTTNPTCQTQAQTRAATMGSQRLTASAMVRPILYIVHYHLLI
jgi:hypothetical protein